MNIKLILTVLFITLFAAIGCAQVKTVTDYKKTVAQYRDQNPQLIDVRTPDEFKSGHNDKSINIPLDTIKEKAKLVAKDRPVLIACRSGHRASQAIAILKKLGYTNVYNAGPWTNLPKDK